MPQFVPRVTLDRLPPLVNPRRTVALKFFGESAADAVWAVHHSRAFTVASNVLAIVAVTGIACAFFDDAKQVAWMSLAGAVRIPSILMLNTEIIGALIRTPDVLFVLGIFWFSIALLLDCFQTSAPRICALLVWLVLGSTTCFLDARPLSRTEVMMDRAVVVGLCFATCNAAAVLIAYYSGLMGTDVVNWPSPLCKCTLRSCFVQR